jgi:hypothetical protein
MRFLVTSSGLDDDDTFGLFSEAVHIADVHVARPDETLTAIFAEVRKVVDRLFLPQKGSALSVFGCRRIAGRFAGRSTETHG